MFKKMSKKRKAKVVRRKRGGKLKLDFISTGMLSGLSMDQKIARIIKRVRDNHIVVLDESLDFIEEAKLVTSTMKEIDTDFKGIEFCTLPRKAGMFMTYATKALESLTGRPTSKPGLTLVGPSTIIREIKRDPNAFYVSAEL